MHSSSPRDRASASESAVQLRQLQGQVIVCRKCPRLAAYRAEVACQKKAAFQDWEYWGRPVPSFGDPKARLLVTGLAPAAHGGNRTGRVFTGDRSGDFLFAALYRAGFANQPASRHRGDGLELRDAYITAVLRCCPPGNKPTPRELANCRSYFERELTLLPNLRAILALGKIAFDACLGLLRLRGHIPSRAAYRFEHGASYELPGGLPVLFASYHPSQQNTFTGKLTPRMFDSVFKRIRRLLKD
jgi:uracil-DNA glycosylase family 4